MNDMNAFERDIGTEVLLEVGPSEPVDDLAILTAITNTTQSRKWRLQPMVGAAKFAVAGLVVALFGGFLLISVTSSPTNDGRPAVGGSSSERPSSTQHAIGSDPITSPKEDDMLKLRTPIATVLAVGMLASPVAGVTAQEADADPMAPAVVNGIIVSGAWDGDFDGTEAPDGVTEIRDIRQISQRISASDPRIRGVNSYLVNWDNYEETGFQVEAGRWDLTNQDGSWKGTTTALAFGEDGDGLNVDTVILVGEDAYDGLLAYLLVDWAASPPAFQGAIFPRELPPFPGVE